MPNNCKTGNCGPAIARVGCITRTPSDCIYYSGVTLSGPGINPGDDFNTVTSKLVNYSGGSGPGGSVTSVGLVMPQGFTVANTPITSNGEIVVTTALNGLLAANGASFVTAGVSAPLSYMGGVLSIAQSSGGQNGYLSSSDYLTFSNKVSSTRQINTTFPLQGGGDLSANRTLTIAQASSSQGGYLSATDWTTFNNKQSLLVSAVNIKTINGISPLGSGDISISSGGSYVFTGGLSEAGGTVSIANLGVTTGKLADLSVTNQKIDTVAFSKLTAVPTATGSTNGLLTSTDWNTLMNKQAALISGTNIKTINGQSVLGAGDLAVSGGGGAGVTQYYVNNSGLSSGDGATPATAINLARFQTLMGAGISNADVYFAAGQTFRAQIYAGSNVTLSRYGTGVNPIILGSFQSSPYTWTQAGLVWSTIITNRVAGMFLNGVRQRIAQSAFYTVTGKPSATQITAAGATGLSNVTSMEMVSKEYEFRWTYNTISAYNSGTGTFTIDTANYIANNYQFKLINHNSLIAADGDWAWHSNILYYRSPGNVNPNTLNLEMSIIDVGLDIADGAVNVSVDGVDFKAQAKDGIYSKNITGLTVRNSEISNQAQMGIFVGGQSANIDIQYVNFHDIAHTGQAGYNMKHSIINNNIVNNIGTQVDPPFVRERTARYDNCYACNLGLGIGSYSSYGQINNNKVTNVAYIGIRADGHDIDILNNFVDNAMTRANDGAGIYTNGNDGLGGSIAYNLNISGNIVSRCEGHLEGGGSTNKLGAGIYTDNYTNYITMKGNTVFDNDIGLFVGGSTRFYTIQGNTGYNNSRTQLIIVNWPGFDSTSYGTTDIALSDNRFASLNSTQRAIEFFDFGDTDFNPFTGTGYAINNVFISPYTIVLMNLVENAGATTYSLAMSDARTFYGKNFGQQDTYTSTYVSEAQSKIDVPLVINNNRTGTIFTVPENYRNPLSKLYDPTVYSNGSALFINQPYAGGGGSSSWTSYAYASTTALNYNGPVSIGTTSPFPGVSTVYTTKGLDVNGGAIMMGSNASLDGNRTNNEDKSVRVFVPHYNNSEEPVTMIVGGCTSSDSFVAFGGITSVANAAKNIYFNVAANTTTLSGTTVLSLNTSLATLSIPLRLSNLAGNGAGYAAIDNAGNVTWSAGSGGGGGGGDMSTTSANTMGTNGAIYLPYRATGTNLRVGALEWQSVDVNTNYELQNTSANAGVYTRTADGYGSLIYRGYGSFGIYTSGYATAGSTVTMDQQMTISSSGITINGGSNTLALPTTRPGTNGYAPTWNTDGTFAAWASISGGGGGGGDMLLGFTNTMGSSGSILFPSNATSSNLRVGTLGFQNTATNTSYIFENMYIDGADYKFRNNGYGSLMYFGTGSFGFFSTPSSGTSGAIASPVAQFTVSALGAVAVKADVEINDIGGGVIIKSPDGTRYRITVANGGALVTTAI